MRQIRQLKQYSTSEIGSILESLRKSYDIVRVVDVEECRVIQIQPDSTIHHNYLAFLDSSSLEKRISASKRGFINTKIRTQDEDGSYSNKMYLAVAAGNHEVILLVRFANL